jgi:hypothetical protein
MLSGIVAKCRHLLNAAQIEVGPATAWRWTFAEVIMSSELCEVEARLLLEELNQRTRAMAVLRSKPRRLSWPMFFNHMLLAGAMIGLMELYDDRQGYLLPSILIAVGVFALLDIVEAYDARLNKRIDALVELLQQEGMLRPELPPERVQEE